MKKIISILAVALSISPLAAQTVNEQVTRAVTQAVQKQCPAVKVWVKLTKPVHMSDVMFRRPRGKDIIIDWKQKENTCTGTLHANLQRVYIPAACVQEEEYQIAQVKMTFANGRTLQTSGKAVRIVKDKAFIALQ